MHPNPLFRSHDRAAMAAMIDAIGFGMVFAATPQGPRVVHTPLVTAGEDRVRFHISRGNALADHLDGTNALVVANGPDGYVSPRWYADRDTVPTWDYVALELEGPVERLADADLERFLHDLIERSERNLAGRAWQAGEASEQTWSRLFRGIVGFELTIAERRPTFKLSQAKPAEDRAAIRAGHLGAANPALADAMRDVAA